MLRFASVLTVLLFGCLLSAVSTAAVIEGSDKVFRQGQIDDDYYAAGGEVTINADVDGDVLAAGGNVSVEGRIQGDLSAAGGSVSVRGNVTDDLRLAGGQVEVDAVIGDDLLVTGGDIRLGASTRVNGDTRIAAGDITVMGVLNGDLKVAAGNLTISGKVMGDVDFVGQNIELLDGAAITGDLNYKLPDDKPINPNASVGGSLLYEEGDWEHDSGGGFGFLLPLTLIVAAILFLMTFPNYSVASAKRLPEKPLNHAGLGLLFLIFTPIVAFLLMVIILGFWVGLALLVLYLLAILAGYLIGCIFVGDWGAGLFKQPLSTRARRYVSVALAIVALTMVYLVPFLGGLLGFVLLITGIGAGLIQLHQQYRENF